MKRISLAFAALLVPLDFCLVFLAALTAYNLRYSTFRDLRPVFLAVPYNEFLFFAITAAAVFVLCFAFAGLYAVSSPRRLKIEISRILLASAAAMTAVIVLIFFKGDYFTSRFIILAAWGLATAYVCVGRVIVRFLQRALLSYGIGAVRTVIIGGSDHTTLLLVDALQKNPIIGHLVVAQFSHFDAATKSAIEKLCAKDSVDELFITSSEISRHTLAETLAFAESHHLGFKYAADLVATHARNIEVSAISGIPFVEVKGTKLEGWGRILKRLFDIIGSAILIVVTSPIMLVTAIAILFDSRGPVFFWQRDDGTPMQRAGVGGKPFTFIKFRSMVVGRDSMRYKELTHLNAGKNGPVVKIGDNDPRVTRVGKFIRKYSIDELPQLFLVFIGKMSLVGPRPHVLEEVAKYQAHHRRVLMIRPGITGLAQVSGRRDLNFEDEVRLDTFYIENWSIWLDLSILLKTPFAVFRTKGAY